MRDTELAAAVAAETMTSGTAVEGWQSTSRGTFHHMLRKSTPGLSSSSPCEPALADAVPSFVEGA